MLEPKIRFADGAAYDEMMGVWSRSAGEIFLAWLSPPAGLRWIDIGCGNGAFTELLVERCSPAEVQGIDPSEGQLAFARTRLASRVAEFRHGDAMALPFSADRFDAAVMALVLVFVSDPAKAWQKWFGWSPQEVSSLATFGTWSEGNLHLTRSLQRCAPWLWRPRNHRGLMRLE